MYSNLMLALAVALLEAKKVCDYADTYDIRVQAHVCGGPVATAAALQLEAAIPNFLIHEHHTYAIKHWNRELYSGLSTTKWGNLRYPIYLGSVLTPMMRLLSGRLM